jgi:FkbM family methyltransferase
MPGTIKDRLRRLGKRFEFFGIALHAAAELDDPVRFMLGEIKPIRRRAGVYRLKGRVFLLRHGLAGDLWIFKEIFLDRVYALGDRIAPPSRIVDLGGNIGLSVLHHAIMWPEAEIIAFEPDPGNVRFCRAVFERNRLRGELVEACAATADGTVPFAAGLHGGSHVSDDAEGPAVAAVDVFPYLDGADLVKIDIEGSEWPIMMDPRFAGIPAKTVLMEYHPAGCPGPDAREEAERLLRDAGFKTELIFHGDYNGVGMLRAFRD